MPTRSHSWTTDAVWEVPEDLWKRIESDIPHD